MSKQEYIQYFTIYLNKLIFTVPRVILVIQGSGRGLFLCRVIKRCDWLSIVLVGFNWLLCSLNSALSTTTILDECEPSFAETFNIVTEIYVKVRHSI